VHASKTDGSPLAAHDVALRSSARDIDRDHRAERRGRRGAIGLNETGGHAGSAERLVMQRAALG